MSEPPPETRRGFLGLLTIVLSAVPILGGLYVALRSGLAPAHSDKPERLPLCRLADVPEDGLIERAVSFQVRRGPKVESVARVVFVTRDPQSAEVIAMAGECTHLSCPVQIRTLIPTGEPEGAALACPCHGGRFSRTGEVLDGPPPAPLRRLRIELPEDDGGMIYLLEV